jgi:hypothetical protein
LIPTYYFSPQTSAGFRPTGKTREPVSKRPILADLKRWAQISILEILNVLLWLQFSPALTSAKLKRFEIGSRSRQL